MKTKAYCMVLALCMLTLCSCSCAQIISREIKKNFYIISKENISEEDVPISDKKNINTIADCEWLLESSIEDIAIEYGVDLAHEPSGEILLEGRTLVAPVMYLNKKLALLTPYTILPKEAPIGITLYGEPKEATPIEGIYFGMKLSEIDSKTYTISDSFIKMFEAGQKEKVKVVEIPINKTTYRCVFYQDGDKFSLDYIEVFLTSDDNKAPIEILKSLKRESFKYAVTSVAVMDINGDSLPEVILNCADGWAYEVYYYINGVVRQVGDLSAWAWSSGLYTSATGDLVLSVESHTTGTAGNLQYRIYHWDGVQYTLDIDLNRIPIEWDEQGTPVSYRYFSSNTCIDLLGYIDEEFADQYNTITKEEFDAKISSLGTLTHLQLPSLEQGFEENDQAFYEYLRAKLDDWK